MKKIIKLFSPKIDKKEITAATNALESHNWASGAGNNLVKKFEERFCKYIGAKSLKFLSLNGLYRAIGFKKRNETYPQLTDHYFTGDYPIKPIDDLGDSKVTQLSLLSTASNS